MATDKGKRDGSLEGGDIFSIYRPRIEDEPPSGLSGVQRPVEPLISGRWAEGGES